MDAQSILGDALYERYTGVTVPARYIIRRSGQFERLGEMQDRPRSDGEEDHDAGRGGWIDLLIDFRARSQEAPRARIIVSATRL